MPIYNVSLTAIDINETKRYAGLSKADFPPKLLEDACLEAQLLAQSKGVWQLYDYDNCTNTILAAENFTLIGKKIATYLKEADKIAVMAITIGEALEQAITEHFAKGSYSYAVLLDAAGTTAVEMAADQLSKSINQHANRLGYTTLPRFSPGYGDWNITAQPSVLAFARGQDAGITLTESCMLIPRKSVTAVIGFVPHRKAKTELPSRAGNHCDNCTQPDCQARKDDC